MKYKHTKRILDLLFCVITFPLVITIIFFAGLLNKILHVNEKIFFIQKRIGYKNRHFNIYKIRTMSSYGASNNFASQKDFRVDKYGLFLRKYRIDELPQFLNIFKGDMSLIGPRPEQVHIVDDLVKKYGNKFYKRHDVLPGITGLSQVEFGYVANYEDYFHKLEYDLEYVKNFNFITDLKIFFKTFGVILFKFGSR
tara:strand:+ start:27545 stop:28132 length:588 start_codon:yes stop_codon:yes gene_type:complete